MRSTESTAIIRATAALGTKTESSPGVLFDKKNIQKVQKRQKSEIIILALKLKLKFKFGTLC